MSFISKINDCKNNKPKDIKQLETCFEVKRSLNYIVKDNDLKNAKVVIVGTISPNEAISNGYFYTGSKNQMLKIIDNYFGSNLAELKKEPEKLHEEIIKKGIIFLDVIDYAAILPKGSSYDDDIVCFNLDYDKFNKLTNRKDIVYLFNSINSAKAFKEICIKNGNIEDYNEDNYCKLFRGADYNKWKKKFNEAGLLKKLI